jgi:hypothetical protein
MEAAGDTGSEWMDRVAFARKLDVHPGDFSFDHAWGRIRGGMISPGDMVVSPEGSLLRALSDPFRLHVSESQQVLELMQEVPKPSSQEFPRGYLEDGELWLTFDDLCEQGRVSCRHPLARAIWSTLRQMRDDGLSPVLQGHVIKLREDRRANFRLTTNDVRFAAAVLRDRVGMPLEQTEDWVSEHEAKAVLTPTPRIARVLQSEFLRLRDQVIGGQTCTLGGAEVIAQMRTVNRPGAAPRPAPFVCLHRSCLEALAHALGLGQSVSASPPSVAHVTKRVEAVRSSLLPSTSEGFGDVSSAPTRDRPAASASTTADEANPRQRWQAPALSDVTHSDYRTMTMADGGLGRAVLYGDDGRAWGVALGRGLVRESLQAGCDGVATWLGVDPHAVTVEEACAQPITMRAEPSPPLATQGDGFRPETLVMEAGGSRVALTGQSGIHAMARGISLVGPTISRRELVTAWGEMGIGLLALDDRDRGVVAEVGEALAAGRLALAFSEETGPVLVLADRVEPGLSLEAVTDAIRDHQRLNRTVGYVRLRTPPPGASLDPAPR